MRELPRGTVTFLFTDIEGSTRLLHELGPGYAEALAEHRRVLREAFERHGGVEVDTQGDAFFVAFRDADAVAAAEQGQRALAAGPIRVRIGLHSGEPVVDATKATSGSTSTAAARIAAAGARRPGRALARHAGARRRGRLRDLGEHRLEGPLGARADLPARQRRVPAAEDALPDEPARAGDAVRRPGARAGRGSRAARAEESGC